MLHVVMGIAAILAENERLRHMVAVRDADLAARDAELAVLRAANDEMAKQLAWQRWKREQPQSERFVPDHQLPLLPDAEAHPPPPPPTRPKPEPAENAPVQADKKLPKRRNLAERDDLRTRNVPCRVAPDSACARCGGTLRIIGTQVSWRLNWVPGHFERDRIERDRCACPNCPSQGVLVAEEPSYALRKALCGNGLLAAVLVDKFCDHLPLNRQVERMKRQGVELATSTLCGWVSQAAALLGVVKEAIVADLLTAPQLQGDDTGFPVQDGTHGKLRQGRLWALTDQSQVVYHFTDSKHGWQPASFLESFQGHLLLVDGGSEFNEVVRERGLVRAGCWSHLRRYFYEARLDHPIEARVALATIRDLFDIERAVWRAGPDLISEVRQRDARPLVNKFYDWVEALRRVVRPGSKLGDALRYAHNQHNEMRAFLDHPELPMHNNLSELQLRQGVVGRKNWLFAGSEGGAHAAATLYTLVGSCALQAIDPWAWLSDILDRLPDYPANRVHELTPKRWRLAREAKA